MQRELIGRNLPRVKEVNQFLIREKIYRCGPVSRINVAESLGLTLPTITTNVNKMLSDGLIHEIEDKGSRKKLGRHTMLVDIAPESRLYLGIEIRRGFRTAVIVDLRGKVLASASDFRRINGYEDALANAAGLAKDVMAERNVGVPDISSVGICAPGLVDTEAGVLISLLGYVWKDKPIVRDFSGLTGFSSDIIVVDNNVIARAFGLSMFNHDVIKDADSFAYMYVSTGIGCPLLRDVSEHFGVVVGEGEVGHMVMNPDGPLCACGNQGCLGAYSSELSILEGSVKAVKEGRAPVLKDLCAGNTENITMELVMEAMEKGDSDIHDMLEEAVRYLGLAIANIDNFVKPGCVVIESRYFGYEEYRALLMKWIDRNLYRRSSINSRFVFRPYDQFSGARGAAALAVKNGLESEM